MLIELRDGTQVLQNRIVKEMKPLYEQMYSFQAETVRKMDIVYADKLMKKMIRKNFHI